MNGLGQQLFAHPSFTEDEDGNVATLHPAHLLQQQADLRVSGVQVVQAGHVLAHAAAVLAIAVFGRHRRGGRASFWRPVGLAR